MERRFFALLLAALLFTTLFPLSAFADKYQNVKQNEFMKDVTMKEEEANNDFQSADNLEESKWMGATLGKEDLDIFFFVANPGIYWLEYATPGDYGQDSLSFFVSSGSEAEPRLLKEVSVPSKNELAPFSLQIRSKADVFIAVSKSDPDDNEMPYRLRFMRAEPLDYIENKNNNWILNLHSGEKFNWLPESIVDDFAFSNSMLFMNSVSHGYWYPGDGIEVVEQPLDSSVNIQETYQSLLNMYGANSCEVLMSELTEKEYFIVASMGKTFFGNYCVISNGWKYKVSLSGDNLSRETLMNIATNFSAYKGIFKSFTAPTPSPKPTPTPKPGPGPKDMKGCSSEVTVPNSGSWLNDYVTKSVKSAGGICIILRYYPEKYFEYDGYNFISRVYDGEKVTELARQDGYSLIKVNSSGAVGWAPSNLLVY